MSARAAVLAVAAALSAGAGRPAIPQDEAITRARTHAVTLIMAQIEDVSLDPFRTARDVFAKAPRLRLEAEAVAGEAALLAPVAFVEGGVAAVDVKLAGDLLRDRLERVRKSAGLPPEWAGLSFDAFATGGRRFVVRGRSAAVAGGVRGAPSDPPAPALPAKWRQVPPEGRAHAAGMARTMALADGVRQVVETAVERKLVGASALATVCQPRWLAEAAADLRAGGVRDARGPVFLDDGTCEVEVEVPAAAVFAAIDARGGVQGLPPRIRAELRRALDGVVTTGRGKGVPAAANVRPTTWPRVLRAAGRGRPPAGLAGLKAMDAAIRAARVDALKNLAVLVYRLPVNERQTVADALKIQPDAQGRVSLVIEGATEVGSPKAVGGEWWSVEVEVELDRLSAALQGR